jgi:hypothetical protein
MAAATATRDTRHEQPCVTHEDFRVLLEKFVEAPTQKEAQSLKKELMDAFYAQPHAED